MRSTVPWFLLAATIFLASSASAETPDLPTCEPERSPRVDALSTIGLRAIGLPRNVETALAEAASLWNLAPCEASGRPRFVLGAPGERTLAVRWLGFAAAAEPGVCGSFTGKEIRIFGFARDRETGALARCGDRDRLVEVIAHELGHALGLRDQMQPACSGQIMGQLVRRPDGELVERTVHAEECVAVERRFLTVSERLAGLATGEGSIASVLRRPSSPYAP